jgi:hypothetical protein
LAQQTAAMIAATQGQAPAAAQEVDPNEARRQFQQASDEWDLETARRRKPLYEDVETLVETGFLSHQVRIGSLNLSFRSLFPSDSFMLSHRVGLRASSRQWQTWSVASAVWMVDGMCLLDDPEAPSKMYRLVKDLPPTTIDTLFSIVIGLFRRTGAALTRTEAYCYEPYSRATWRMCGRQIPSKTGGVPGIDRLGMNHVQRMWVAYNLAEDDRDQMLREWSAAKLVASASSPKGIKKLNTADERLRTTENTRRRDAVEKMVEMVMYGKSHKKEQQLWRVRVQGELVEVPAMSAPRTEEGLQDEFRRWVAGEKDWHDIIVDTYKDRIRAKFDDERQTREALLTEAQMEPGVTGGTQMVGYTLEQIREIRPELLSARPSAKKVFDGSAPARTYEKYVEHDAEPGRLRADEHGVWEAPIEQPPARRSLSDQVAARRPALSTDPDQPIAHPSVEDGD